MEEGTKSESHLTSVAAFVEGGTQDACDDACSICLEAFSESDPPAVTGCKHEFHLQCILEWCQRSSQCPMCWQSISLKDPSSQELLDAMEQERSIANNPSMNATIFHHPTFGDLELHHLPVSASDSELEERIIQHLAAAAAMGRTRHIARRVSQRSQTSAQSCPRYLGFSAQPGAPSPSRPSISSDDVEVQEESIRAIAPNNQDRAGAGPSELHSFSEAFRTRVNAISMRYKESITKSTRSWKERLFSRTAAMDLGSGERNSGIASLSRMMDHLEKDLAHASRTTDATTSSPPE